MGEPAPDMTSDDPQQDPAPFEQRGDADAREPAPADGRLRHLWWYWTHRHRENWWQLMKFSVVGGSGYVVNLVVFAFALGVGIHYRPAAVLAFAVANVNNYIWNRYWSFPRQEHSLLLEYARFLAVGLVALGLNLVLLSVFVEQLGRAELTSQALAVVLVTPIGFVGNKLFTFRARTGADAKRYGG